MSWTIENELPAHLGEVQPRRSAELTKQQALVQTRLKREIGRLVPEATAASEKERIGEKPRESADSLTRKAYDLQHRMERRLELIDQQSKMSTKPPLVAAAALVLPVSHLEEALPAGCPLRPRGALDASAQGLALVCSAERSLGRVPTQAAGAAGYNVVSAVPNAGETYRILVKAGSADTSDVWVSHNEVVTGKNAAPRYRLALVRVDRARSGHHDIRYIDDPFASVEIDDFDATGYRMDWDRFWARGKSPF